MGQDTKEGQQSPLPPRNKTVAAAVTTDERRDVALVASAHGMSESDVMRDMTITDITAEAERIRRAASTLPASA